MNRRNLRNLRIPPPRNSKDIMERELRCRDVTAARANLETAVPHFNTDVVPPAVAMARTRVPDVVLLAQLVGDTRGCRVEIARVTNQFGAAAAIVGDLAQRDDVDSIVSAGVAARNAAAAAAARVARARNRKRQAAR